MPDVADGLSQQRVALDREALADFCRHHGIRRLSLFGSRLTGRQRPDSDIDLLAEFFPGRTPTLLDMADMERELEALLGGPRVDLRTPNDLSRYFRDDVLRHAAVQYDAG
jgi:predicted nucleotidyltransferase